MLTPLAVHSDAVDILESHVQALHAIANRVVPADETVGAGDNESMAYVADVMTGELSDRLEELRKFVDVLNVAAKVEHQRRFCDLNAEQQDALLRSVEDQPIFKMLVNLIQEGYWASEAGQATVGFTVSDANSDAK